jgi:hypothetical protein
LVGIGRNWQELAGIGRNWQDLAGIRRIGGIRKKMASIALVGIGIVFQQLTVIFDYCQ